MNFGLFLALNGSFFLGLAPLQLWIIKGVEAEDGSR